MPVTIDGYERFRPIGSGGFSQVYEARQIEFNRRVAIKVLTVGADASFDRSVFEAECRAMGMVSEHPNIVTVYESGYAAEGAPYIAMELYQQTLLDKVRAAGFLPLDQVLSLGVNIAGALHRAHGVSLLHRDIKPQNIFFSQYDEPALGDFGIAAIAHHQHGRALGLTLHYAAPEVLDGAVPTVESDLYSLGVTLYTALAGRRPFAGTGTADSEAAVTNRILTESPPPIAAQDLPANVERSILGLLAKHPNDRPRSALELGTMLRDLQGRLGHPQTPIRLASADPDLDHDATVTRQRDSGSAGAPPAEQESTTGSTSGSITVYRSQARPPGPVERADEPNQTRTIIGIGAFLGVVAVAALGVMLAGRSGDDDLDPIETVPTSTTIVLIDDSPLQPPANVTIGNETGGAVTIAWVAVPDVAQYRVEFLSGPSDPVLVDGPSYELPLDGATTVCVQVRSIGEDRRLSAPSDTVCGP